MEMINYKGKELKIRYQHQHINQKLQDLNEDFSNKFPMIIEGKYNDRVVIGWTKAYLVDNNELVAEAYAYCSDKDVFSKKLGRIIAKGRLIKKVQEEQ